MSHFTNVDESVGIREEFLFSEHTIKPVEFKVSKIGKGFLIGLITFAIGLGGISVISEMANGRTIEGIGAWISLFCFALIVSGGKQIWAIFEIVFNPSINRTVTCPSCQTQSSIDLHVLNYECVSCGTANVLTLAPQMISANGLHKLLESSFACVKCRVPIYLLDRSMIYECPQCKTVVSLPSLTVVETKPTPSAKTYNPYQGTWTCSSCGQIVQENTTFCEGCNMHFE